MAVNSLAVYSDTTTRAIRFTNTGATAAPISIKGLTQFTWEGWVKLKPEWHSSLNELGRSCVWFEARPDKENIEQYSRSRFVVSLTETKVRFSLCLDDNGILEHYTYPFDFSDKWTHIAFAVDTGEQTYDIIINGALVQSGNLVAGGIDENDDPVAVSDTDPSIVSAMRGWYRNVNATKAQFNGGLDFVRIWKTKRSASTVLGGMRTIYTAATANLLGQFNFEDTTDQYLYGVRSANISGDAVLNMEDSSGYTSVKQTTTDRPFLGDSLNDNAPPSVPTMLAPTNIGPTGFTLSWNASTDNVAVQRYDVEVASDNLYNSVVSGWFSGDKRAGRALTINFEDGAPDSTYYARVRAVDAAGNASAWSSYASNAPILTTTTNDYTAPSIPPQNLRLISVSSQSFTVGWERGATEDEVAGYKVYVGLTPSFSSMVSVYRNLDVGLVDEYTFSTDLLPITPYWVRVRSYDQNSNESWDSDTLQVITRPLPDTEAPEEVAMDTATSIEATRFTLRWHETTDNVGVEGYLIDIAKTSDFSTTLPEYTSLDVGKVLRFNVFGVEPVTAYFARVRAYDQAGNISVFESSPLVITTTALTSSEDGYIEAGSQIYEAVQGATTYNYANPIVTLNVNSASLNPLLKFSNVTLIGEPTNPELFVWIQTKSGTGNLTVYQGATLLGTVTPATAASWVSIQLNPLPSNLLTGAQLTLKTTGTLQVSIGTGFTLTNPAPYITFGMDTEKVIRPVESDLSLSWENARNFIPCPDFLHENRTTGNTVSAGLVDDYVQDANWDVTVRKTTMTSGGTFNFYSQVITDSLNKINTTEPLRGAIYLGIISNNGTKNSASFQVKVGVEYSDTTTSEQTSTVEVVDGLYPFFVNGLVLNPAKTITRVYLKIQSVSAYVGSIASYLPTVYQASTQLYPFSGNTYSGKWEESLNFGTSVVGFPEISGDLSYTGDNNNDGTARLALLSREVGLTTNSWYGTGFASKDSVTKVFSGTAGSQFVVNHLGNGSFDIIEDTSWTASLLGAGHTIDTSFGGINLDGDASRRGFRHLNVLLVNKDGASSNAPFGVGNSQVIPKHAVNGSRVKAIVRGNVGAVLTLSFKDSGSSAVTTLHTHTMVSSDWEEITFTIPLGTVSYSGYVRLHMNTSAYSTGQKFSVDGVQFGSTLPFFADESFSGAYSLGKYGQSPVVAFLPYTGVQDVIWLVDDPDGVDYDIRLGQTGIVGDSIQISGAPDNVLTVKDLRAEVTSSSIKVVFEYDGDDTRTSSLDIKWKRADFSEERAWSRVPISWNREKRQATALITGLNPRTNYAVTATVSNNLVPIYGENPIQRVFTTSAPQQESLVTPRILFGGFVLQDQNEHHIWVDSHDAFDHPEREVQVEKLPRYQGSAEISNWWVKKEITLTGGIAGDSRHGLAEMLTALKAALAREQQRLIIDTLDQRSYYFTATCTSLSLPEKAGTHFRHLNWSAKFICADPFRYDSNEIVEQNITLSNGETYKVTNFGDLEISPQVTLTTNSPTDVAVTLINQSTGQRITPVSKIKSGDTLQILSDQLRVVKNGIPVDFSGSFPHLGVGDNTLEIQVFPISYPITMTVQRRHKYF